MKSIVAGTSDRSGNFVAWTRSRLRAGGQETAIAVLRYGRYAPSAVRLAFAITQRRFAQWVMLARIASFHCELNASNLAACRTSRGHDDVGLCPRLRHQSS